MLQPSPSNGSPRHFRKEPNTTFVSAISSSRELESCRNSNFKVAVRVRPPLPRELSHDNTFHNIPSCIFVDFLLSGVRWVDMIEGEGVRIVRSSGRKELTVRIDRRGQVLRDDDGILIYRGDVVEGIIMRELPREGRAYSHSYFEVGVPTALQLTTR